MTAEALARPEVFPDHLDVIDQHQQHENAGKRRRGAENHEAAGKNSAQACL